MKYQLAVKTPDFPVPRVCTFTVLYDSILAYHLQSETLDIWIRKGTLKRAIAEKLTITPDMCELFAKR